MRSLLLRGAIQLLRKESSLGNVCGFTQCRWNAQVVGNVCAQIHTSTQLSSKRISSIGTYCAWTTSRIRCISHRQNGFLKYVTGHRYFSVSPARCIFTLPGTKDRHGGLWVNLSYPQEEQDVQQMTQEYFSSLLTESLKGWKREGFSCIWLTVPISLSQFIPMAWKEGFQYHHAEGELAVLKLWMKPDEENKVPQFATHQVGVSGIVLKEDTREVLVVKDKNRTHTLWKFPGGLSDLGEDIASTAEREVFEETGVRTEFQSILAFRQQHTHPGAFGRSDLYFLCRLKPLTFDLHPCEEEIMACQWMDIEQLCREINASSLTHRVATLVKHGLAHGFQEVDLKCTKMNSIYRGLTFHIFNRPI